MRKFFGTVLILGGVLSLTDFAIAGTLHAGLGGARPHFMLPLLAAGQNYPDTVIKLCFGLGLFVVGLYLILLEGDMNRSPLAGIFLLNALLLCCSLLMALAASQNPQNHAGVGLATWGVLLHLVCGLGLLYFAATERPVGAAGLSLGSLLFVSSAAVGAVVFLGGKA